MKKLFALIFASALSLGASAQINQGDVAAGVNLLYGSGIENLGFGARFQYTIIEQLRAEVEFDYFFKRKDKTWCDINLNAEYLLPLKNDVFYIYPIAGLNYTIMSMKEPDGSKDEENHVGLNLGAGLEYCLNNKLSATLEYRHTIIRKVDQGVIGIGLNYRF